MTRKEAAEAIQNEIDFWEEYKINPEEKNCDGLEQERKRVLKSHKLAVESLLGEGTFPAWRDAENELPDPNKRVLVLLEISSPHTEKRSRTIQFGEYTENTLESEHWYVTSNHIHGGEVTHWMPLPELPEEE